MIYACFYNTGNFGGTRSTNTVQGGNALQMTTTKLQTNHTNVHSIYWFFSSCTVQQVRARVQSEGVYYKIGEPVCTYTHKIVGYELVYVCRTGCAGNLFSTNTHIYTRQNWSTSNVIIFIGTTLLLLLFFFIFPEPIWGIVEIPVRPTRRRASGCT